MTIVKQNRSKSKQQAKSTLAKSRKAQWEKIVDTLVKLLPVLTPLLTALMPLIILIGTYRHWF